MSYLHSPNEAWTLRTHDSPGIRQDRCGMSPASSPFRQNGDSRLAATDRSGFRKQMGLAGRVQTYASTLEIARRRACSAGRQVIAGDLPPVICQAAMQSPSFGRNSIWRLGRCWSLEFVRPFGNL